MVRVEKIRVLGLHFLERRDRRDRDDLVGLELRDQPADALREGGAPEGEVLVVDVDPGDGVLGREGGDGVDGVRDPRARVRRVVPLHVARIGCADVLRCAPQADRDLDVAVRRYKRLRVRWRERGRPVRGEHSVLRVAAGVGVDGERQREDIVHPAHQRDVRERDAVAPRRADVLCQQVAVREQTSTRAMASTLSRRCDHIPHHHDV